MYRLGDDKTQKLITLLECCESGCCIVDGITYFAFTTEMANGSSSTKNIFKTKMWIEDRTFFWFGQLNTFNFSFQLKPGQVKMSPHPTSTPAVTTNFYYFSSLIHYSKRCSAAITSPRCK